MLTPVITVAHLTKRFGNSLAINDLSCTIVPGQITGIVGPDGSGKTTLLRLFAGLLLPDTGTLTVCGYNPSVSENRELQAVLGYMPQRFGLYEDLTVIENLTLYARIAQIPKQERVDIFAHLLHFTQLETFQHRRAKDLSGGMKQKLGIACVLIRKPKLLLLDEPSVGVDPISRRELWALVQNLVTQDMSVIWATAALDEAELCHSVLVLREGQLLYQGLPREMTARVQGRVYLIQVPIEQKRELLNELLQSEAVSDLSIQADHIRVVLKQQHSFPICKTITAAQIHLTTPRFEDALIDFLGGISKSINAIEYQVAATQESDVVTVTHLSKRFGEFVAVADLNFSIRRGEIFGLLGPNGAGKTVTFRMICGLLQPTSGQAAVAGFDLATASGLARARIGYMAQKFSLYGDLTVRQNLEFFCGAYGLSGRVRRTTIDRVVAVFLLQPHLQQVAGELPLGYKQRLSLACSVLHQPDFLFLDEPTSGVDPLTRREFWLQINALVHCGVTVLVTTHFMDEAEYCDRVGLVYQGQLIALGSPHELKQQAVTVTNTEPTMEEAFIHLVSRFPTASDEIHGAAVQ